MLIRTHIGVSLDGFVSSAEGLPAWDAMPSFSAEQYGVGEFMAQCDAIIMGRTSFDQGFAVGSWLPDWPYEGKRVYVLTSRPLPERAAEMNVVAPAGGVAGLVAELRAAGHTGDAELLGGPSAIQAFMDAGALDRLEIVLLPVLLHRGIPLFSIEPVPFSQEAWDASLAAPTQTPQRPLLKLERHRAFPDGALELVYSPA